MKKFKQLNAERAARRARPKKKAASPKPQAASTTQKPQMIFRTILEFEKEK